MPCNFKEEAAVDQTEATTFHICVDKRAAGVKTTWKRISLLSQFDQGFFQISPLCNSHLYRFTQCAFA